MLTKQLFANSIIFSIGSIGLLKSTNMLIVLMCIEMILLSTNLNFVVISITIDDIIGQTFSLLILTVAAAESAIGLAILILYYRLRKSILFNISVALKG